MAKLKSICPSQLFIYQTRLIIQFSSSHSVVKPASANLIRASKAAGNPLTEAAMEGQSFKTEVAAVSMVQWLSPKSAMTITDTGFLVLYPSENGFQKLLGWVPGWERRLQQRRAERGGSQAHLAYFFPFRHSPASYRGFFCPAWARAARRRQHVRPPRRSFALGSAAGCPLASLVHALSSTYAN